MNEDKSISDSSIPLFSKEWAREYRNSLFILTMIFVFFLFNGYRMISACLSHQSENDILRFFGFEVQCVGIAIFSLTDWVRKDYPEREPVIFSSSMLMLILAGFIGLLASAVRFS